MKLHDLLLDAAGILAGEPVNLINIGHGGTSVASRYATPVEIKSPRQHGYTVCADGVVIPRESVAAVASHSAQAQAAAFYPSRLGPRRLAAILAILRGGAA